MRDSHEREERDRAAAAAFTTWKQSQPRGPGQLSFAGAMLKSGPQVAKTATLATFGDQLTGEVRKKELRLRRYQRDRPFGGFDFASPIDNWAIENDEVDRLIAWLNEEVREGGRYRLLDTTSPQATLLELLADAVSAGGLLEAIVERGGPDELVRVLTESPAGLAAAEAAFLQSRRTLVDELLQLAADPGTTESDMQREMGEAYWLFGGRYVGLDRRNLVPMDQHDFVLRTAEGALHIIELKGPNIPKLARKHRNHFIVGESVHEAVAQAMNYLRGFDEHGLSLVTTYRDETGDELDLRRVFATVVIGHPDHVSGATPRQVELALRTYNSHLARVQVITYEQLLQAAGRSLRFKQEGNSEDPAATSLVVPPGQPTAAPMLATAWDDPPF